MTDLMAVGDYVSDRHGIESEIDNIDICKLFDNSGILLGEIPG